MHRGRDAAQTWGAIMIAPYILVFLIFVLYPVCYGFWIARHPDCVNIVYVEGMDGDGTPNDDAPDAFNDLRLLLRINKAGNPEIVASWQATTEPGTYYTKLHKLDRSLYADLLQPREATPAPARLQPADQRPPQ